MFAFSHTAIDGEALKTALATPASGACVTFEGWVRDHNEGKAVRRLSYEAYESMAVKEGETILHEACDRFALHGAHCVHRVGDLAIGEMAVWVGVTSAHRDESFKACRYIIDEVKTRVPIWKKEFYVDGDSGWVNCERCAHHGHLHHNRKEYFDRQTRLELVGEAGQAALQSSRVLIVGVGGLGCPAATYLAAAGVGTIGLCEADKVDLSNLHRQPIYDTHVVGESKVHIAANRLRALNPFINVRTHGERLRPKTAASVFKNYDIILDCTDNFPTKYLINDAAVLLRKTAVVASIYQFEGQLQVVDPRSGGACLRCMWPEMPSPHCVGTCAEVGVVGTVPAIVGSMQAMEALKCILNLPGGLHGELALVDCLDTGVRRIKVARQDSCPVCGKHPAITDLRDEWYGMDESLEYDPDSLAANGDRVALVDIRENGEREGRAIPNAIVLPLSQIDLRSPPIETDRTYVFVCAQGIRSRHLAYQLRRNGYANVYSLRGGLSRL